MKSLARILVTPAVFGLAVTACTTTYTEADARVEESRQDAAARSEEVQAAQARVSVEPAPRRTVAPLRRTRHKRDRPVGSCGEGSHPERDQENARRNATAFAPRDERHALEEKQAGENRGNNGPRERERGQAVHACGDHLSRRDDHGLDGRFVFAKTECLNTNP